MVGLSPWLSSAVIIWLYMSFWYIIALIKRRNDVADFAWGLGFIVITVYNLYSNPSPQLWIVFLLVSLWGFRLAYHIFRRLSSRPEDYRYQQMRYDWGKNFYLRSYLQVFILQGVFMWLISLPIFFATDRISWLNLFGIAIWFFGYYFETTADAELASFIANPKNKNKIMDQGLWAISRHPNYFGEVTMWWGIWLLTLGPTSPYFTIIGPLTISYLITQVSGIPLLEKKYVGNKLYEVYKKKTNVFFPKIF
jgi:steroid 5-alpha reductase family enzyme